MIECGFYHGDCMDYLPDMPDKSIDLAICDPPYGIGFEIDEDYYRMAKERLDAAEAQVNIFDFMKEV